MLKSWYRRGLSLDWIGTKVWLHQIVRRGDDEIDMHDGHFPRHWDWRQSSSLIFSTVPRESMQGPVDAVSQLHRTTGRTERGNCRVRIWGITDRQGKGESPQ